MMLQRMLLLAGCALAGTAAAADADQWRVPVAVEKLDNGLTVLVSEDHIEPAPVAALEPMLWLEADRMRTLDFNPETLKNQQDVVKEEIRNNVQNQPYGGFMWIDIGQHAFSKWENNHDGYGSFHDLETASLDDVRAFHRDYYGPNNAVLSIAGAVPPEQGFALAHRCVGVIPARPTPPRPDYTKASIPARSACSSPMRWRRCRRWRWAGRCPTAAAATRRRWRCWARCWPMARLRACTRAWSRSASWR